MSNEGDFPGKGLLDLEQARQAAEMIKALSHPGRLRIVALLCQREHHVSQLAEVLDLPQSVVSQQLRFLRMQGLVEVMRSKGHAHYRLASEHLKDMIRCIENCCLS